MIITWVVCPCSNMEHWQASVIATLSEVGLQVPNLALQNARHLGMRDLAKWAGRMQVSLKVGETFRT